jgi:hypothetical protein
LGEPVLGRRLLIRDFLKAVEKGRAFLNDTFGTLRSVLKPP